MGQLKEDREIETPKDEIHNLKNRVSNNERYLRRESLIIMTPPITQQGNQTVDTLAFLLEEVLVSIAEKYLQACLLLKKLQDESEPPAMK